MVPIEAFQTVTADAPRLNEMIFQKTGYLPFGLGDFPVSQPALELIFPRLNVFQFSSKKIVHADFLHFIQSAGLIERSELA
ncbi:hypothetical protein OOJ09_11565 [Mesorhizobium qingshengii]|uniref:Uncharacterized protein n=1 Tax=Mesorhizobium qingshengii TaxID=1165689 RepID=A0ABT4QTB5_9HYPH|nr:hypothetical protein [Mesorhizobium qingshengii]MCZ8544821.1 hypothetical protein [Mesorhizobium qingshengii]